MAGYFYHTKANHLASRAESRYVKQGRIGGRTKLLISISSNFPSDLHNIKLRITEL